MRPNSLHHTTHYQMCDFRHATSAQRIDPDLLAMQVWADTWDDSTTPRTDRPVRFQPRRVEPFGLRWGMVNRWAIVAPSAVTRT